MDGAAQSGEFAMMPREFAPERSESEPGAMLQFTHDGRSLPWKKQG
jgi:hypothetical protein